MIRAPTRALRRWLVLVALVAALARAAYELQVARDNGPVGMLAGNLLGDERAYDGFARQVAAGTLQRERAFYQEPLYAWTLGQVYRAFPPAPIAPEAAVVPKDAVHVGVICVQHLLGVLMAVLVALLGARCLGPAVGVLAGLFAALSGPTIFAEAMLLKEGAALALWVLSLHLWLELLEERPGRRENRPNRLEHRPDRLEHRPDRLENRPDRRGGVRRAALLGALLGLGILLRGNTYLLLGAVLLSLLLRVGGTRRVSAAAVVLACALLALLPATLHNLRRGDFVLSTYQSGSNAAIGQPDNDVTWRGVAYEPLHAGRGDAAFEEPDAVALAQAATGRRMTGREISAWWWRQVADSVARRPAVAATRIGLKLLHAFHGDEVPDVKDWHFFVRAVPWLDTPLSDLRWLGPLALLGFVLLPWRCRGLLVVRGSVLVVMATLALFYVMGRYRLSAAPGLWILAAGAIVSGARLLIGAPPSEVGGVRPGAAWLRRLGAGALAVGVVLAGQIPIRPDADGLQVSWANLSSIELARATAAVDAEAARTHRDAAVAAAQQALALAPDYPEARSTLIRALDASSPALAPRTDEAWDQAWRLLLVMHGARTGTPVSGLVDAPLQQVIADADALRGRPGLPERAQYVADALAFACRRVAQGLKDADTLPAALELLDESLRLVPDDLDAQVQRGLVLKRMGRLQEAEAAYRQAQALGADTVELHNNLGNLLLTTGRVAEAEACFERALALAPDNVKVRENLERARAAR